MEQIIAEKPIIITPEKTKKQAVKRGITQMTMEEGLKREKIHQQEKQVDREEREELIECEKLEKMEKRVKLLNDTFIAKSTKVYNTFGHNGTHESVLELHGNGFGNHLSLSLLSSSASLQENVVAANNSNLINIACSPMRALSQMSTSYSNLDDESLNDESSAIIPQLKKSIQDECISSHFLSQKMLSDDEDEEEYAKSSSSNPIPNLTSLQSLDQCPLHGQSQLKNNEISISQQTIASLQVEEKSTASSSTVKKVTIINSASFLNREHTKKWSQDETLKFYKGLELFGTDFSMISRLFTNRTRKMCKNKFRKEEKVNINEIEKRLLRNRSLRMKKVVQKLNALRAKLNLKHAKTPEERIQIIQNARRARLDSFNSIDSLDINVVETIESQLNGQALF